MSVRRPVPQSILVSRPNSFGLIGARMIAPFILLGGVAFLQLGGGRLDNLIAGITLTFAGSLTWIGVELHAARRRSNQMWIQDTGDGFDVRTRNFQYHVPYRSITALAIRMRRRHRGGELQSVSRTWTVWSHERPEPVTLISTIKGCWVDPLEPAFSRIWQQVIGRATSDLQSGRAVQGDGWQLSSRAFTWGKPQQIVARTEIDACEELHGQVCIWRRGHEDAVVKIPADGRNACLLPALLNSATTLPDPVSLPPRDGSSKLGQTLYELRPNSTNRLLGYVGGALLVICGIALQLNRESLGVTFCYVGVPWFLWAYCTGFKVFRCRELGIQNASLFTYQELRFVDLAAFSYTATRAYQRGIFVGMRVTLELIPEQGSGPRRITFCQTLPIPVTTLDEMRDFIAQTIAVRMEPRFAAGEAIRWTPNLTLTPEGIQYLPKSRLTQHPVHLLRFSECGEHRIDDDVFQLYKKGETKPCLSEPTSALNFFPGYLLFVAYREKYGVSRFPHQRPSWHST